MEYYITKCKNCSQKLRIPLSVGGNVAMCPECHRKIYLPFKVARN